MSSSSRRSMTRDIHESIRQLLGKNVKILLKSPVKLELKGGDKTENRILVFTAHRLFIMTAKVPARIDHHYHYLDLRGIESKSPAHVSFTFQAGGHDKTVTFSFRPNLESAPDGAVDDMLCALISAVRRIFPGVPVERVVGQIKVEPAAKRPSVQGLLTWTPPDLKLVGPCGGFSVQYACMCDYYSLPFREEVAWDVDTIYFSHDSHEMCLQDFEHLDHRDQLCILSSLEHNTWFNRLKASGNSSKLPADVCDRILQVVAKSSSLQELHVSGIGVRWDFASRLAQAMASNPVSALASVDLSCNLIEDKGLKDLSGVIAKQHSKGLHHVNLSYCSISAKGLTNLASALASSRVNSTTLTYLNLAGNSLKDENQALCSFLAQPNVVAILDLSSTDTPLDGLFGALVRGCVSALTHLNLSRNPFSASRKAKEIPAAFKQYFASTLVLQYLNVSHCKVPGDAVKNLLLGLACNENTTNVELNLSSNSLGAVGAQVIENCVGGVKCITRLDLSDNSIDAEMAGVMHGIARSHSILSLNVSRNMTGTKPKHLPAVMEAVVHLIQDEETVLQKLNLSDCKLKSEINNVINALGSNQCLQHLDISGNLMGDMGARLLAKALQINTRLHIVNLDRNGITLQGYTDITYALQSNYAMRHIPFPTYDLQPFVKTHPERVDGLVHRMQELLQRNTSPHRFRNTAQAFRLTQGFLLSSTQQILDRVSAQAQDNIDTLMKLNPEVADSEDVNLARGMIQDAENSKHLLSALHEVTARGTNVDKRLKEISSDLTDFMKSHVRENVEAMIGCAVSQCPRIMNASGTDSKRAELRDACVNKCQISPDFVSGLIMDQLGLEVHNKINELNLIVANHISDRVIDEVVEGLGAQSKVLVSEVGSLRKKRSLTPDSALSVSFAGKARSSSASESLEQESLSLAGGDATSQKSESSPLGTPQTSKRLTLQGRKLRPKSVSDGKQQQQHEDRDETASTSPVHSVLKNGPREEGEDDKVPELPSTSALQHLGKARPRRSKRHAPTRGSVVQPAVTGGGDDNEDDGGMARFYSSPANSSFSPGSTPSGSPMQDSLTPNTANNSGLASSAKDDSPATPTTAPDAGKEEKRMANLFGAHRRQMSPEVERKSKMTVSSGLSCLASATTNEDEGTAALAKPSPEKRSLSPSLHSISDIFSSSKSKDKHSSSPRPDYKGLGANTSTAASSVAGVSPFAARKTDSELLAGVKRRSYGAASGDDDKVSSSLSPTAEDLGKRTPEGVVKRVGVGHGGNLDLMAEMKEKRASMVPKVHSGASEGETGQEGGKNSEESKTSFPQIKLRSTGLVGSLSSPTTDFAGAKGDDADDDKEDCASKGGSIVGLRSSRFSSGASPSSPTTANTSSHSNNEEEASSLPASALQPKPKPLPKPRPWSIVGVDRKTGDLTAVSAESEKHKPLLTSSSTGNSGAHSAAASAAALAASSRKSSVRDLINNMNKGGGDGPTPAPRKGSSSLPRGAPPPTRSSVAEEDEEGLEKDRKLSSSPGQAKSNKSKTECTSDDPRILKLDDDFAYDEVLDV